MVRNQTEKKSWLPFGKGNKKSKQGKVDLEKVSKEVSIDNGYINIGENSIPVANWRDLSLEEMKLLQKYIDDLYKKHANTEVKLASAETKKQRWIKRIENANNVLNPKSGVRTAANIGGAVTTLTFLVSKLGLAQLKPAATITAIVTVSQYLELGIAYAIKKLGNMKVSELEQAISTGTEGNTLISQRLEGYENHFGSANESLIAQITQKEEEKAEAERIAAEKEAERIAAEKEAEKKRIAAEKEAEKKRIAKAKEQKAYEKSKKYLDFLTTSRFIVGRNFIVEKFLTEKHRNMYMENVQGRTMEENNVVAETAREVFKEVGGERRYTNEKVARLSKRKYANLVDRTIARDAIKNELEREAQERADQETTNLK